MIVSEIRVMSDRELFERILDADTDVRVTYAVMGMGDSAKARGDATDHLAQRKARFFALLDQLDTPEKVAAFREFRRALREGKS